MRDTLKMNSGGGLRHLAVGLPFLLMSLFMGYQILLSRGDLGGKLPILGFISIFCAVGVGLVFGRRGADFHRGSESVVAWWGLLFLPFSRKTRRWDEFERVHLSTRIVRTKNGSYTVYPVRLEGKGDGMLLMEMRDYLSGRATAEKAAKFMNLGMLDDGGEVQVFREPGTMDESVRDRLRRTGERPAVASPPELSQIRLEVGDSDISFQFPEPEVSPVLVLIGSVIALGLIGAIGYFVEPFFGVILALFLLPGVYRGLRDYGGVDRLTVDRDTLRLVRSGPAGTMRREIPLDELEDLEVSTRRGRIVARSDKLTLTIGAKLGPDEAGWVVDTLKLAMVGE